MKTRTDPLRQLTEMLMVNLEVHSFNQKLFIYSFGF